MTSAESRPLHWLSNTPDVTIGSAILGLAVLCLVACGSSSSPSVDEDAGASASDADTGDATTGDTMASDPITADTVRDTTHTEPDWRTPPDLPSDDAEVSIDGGDVTEDTPTPDVTVDVDRGADADAGVEPPGEPYGTLTVTATDADAWEGNTLFISVVEPIVGGPIAGGSDIITGGTIGFSWPAVYPAETPAYVVRLWADTGGDGDCDLEDDPVWEVAVDSPDMSIALESATPHAMGCSLLTWRASTPMFDLTVTGSGFEPWEGQAAWIAIENTALGLTTLRDVATITDGGFVFEWVGVFDSDLFGLFLTLYVDADANGRCQVGVDPTWSVFASNSFDFEAAHVQVAIEADSEPQSEQAEICDPF